MKPGAVVVASLRTEGIFSLFPIAYCLLPIAFYPPSTNPISPVSPFSPPLKSRFMVQSPYKNNIRIEGSHAHQTYPKPR